MLKNIPNKQDVVVIGGGTSGIMSALGAAQYGLKVTLIANHTDFSQSSLLTEFIPTKAFAHAAMLANTIRQAKHFGLSPQLPPINLAKINDYIRKVVADLQQENDIDTFERLGGSVLIGNAKFINNHSVLVNNIQINSKYFIIATGARESVSNILDFDQSEYVSYKQIFQQTNLSKKTFIIGSRPESLEIAQSLAKFGSKVVMICLQKKILPLEDPEFTYKLQTTLEQDGISFYFVKKILQFYWQNKRKLLICQDYNGDKLAIDGDEIINMSDPVPNVEELALQNAGVRYLPDGVLVNRKLQTTQKNIFALGSVIKSPFKSVHLAEHQTNIIISNIAFNVPRKINYQLIPRVLFTCPQLATIGFIQKSKSIKEPTHLLQFDFKNIDAAIYQQQPIGGIKLLCKGDRLLGASILGPMATEIIAEFCFAMQVGAGVSEIANSIHVYPTLSNINKRAAHKIFNTSKTTTTVTLEKAMYMVHQMFAKLSFVN